MRSAAFATRSYQMATKVIMPKAGMAMEEGILVNWLKKVGDTITRGEPIAEIETDKTMMELEAELSGTLLSIVRGVGEHVAVTEVIAWIGAPGEVPPEVVAGKIQAPLTAKDEATPASPSLPGAENPSGKTAATPAARRIALEAGIDISRLPVPPSGAFHAEEVRKHIRKDVTPLASRIAEASGIDPSALPRAEGQRARKVDAEAAVLSRAQGSVALAPAGTREDRFQPFTPIQRITGERLSQSHAEIPAVTVFAVADATDFLRLREELNASGKLRISINDLIIRACAKALVANPRANAVVQDGGLLLKGGIHIGIAVATDAGLLVPTLRNADLLPLAELSIQARDLAERARKRRLRPEELEGGTFTISNIGMYGVTAFTPIINQPQVGILGIGTMEDRLALDSDGRPTVRKALHLSFTFDHRALDGAESASFIKAVKELIEAPLLILV
jgi:pyruvate dehydrogenase E2 component (dihydrolipoamide acetyltransferase)